MGSVPQILINREPLPHLTPDVELLGDCDGIINQICHMLGQGWEDPVHSDPLVEISELTPKTESTSTTMTLKTEENNTTAAGSEPTTPSKQEATSGQDEVTSGQVTSGEEAVSAGSEATSSKPSSLSNEDLAKMYQPKTRPSLAQRLKPNEFLFTSPNRYVFPGAEVIDRDDEAGDSSDDNVDKKNPSNSNDNKDGSDHKNLEINPENSNPTPSESKKEETEK